jgi:mannose-1-phosphate guanylyltransferase
MLPVMVLTAGVGSRLDPITRLVAKPAVPLAGQTLIERVLGWLQAQGARDVVLNLHAHPETIAAVVGDGAHLDLHVRYSWEQPLLGSAGGPRRALPLLDADVFVIVNGDTLCTVDLEPIIARHRDSGAQVTLGLIRNPAPDLYNSVLMDADDRVTDVVPKRPGSPKPSAVAAAWHFVGIQIVNAAVFAPLADGKPAETVAGIYRTLMQEQPGSVRGWRIDAPFLDVGTPREYLHAALALTTQADGNAFEPGSTIDSSAALTHSVVWATAMVGADVELSNCIVAGTVHVPEGFRAENSVVLPASCAQPEDRITRTDGLAIFPLRT